jgi:hypothetical protein
MSSERAGVGAEQAATTTALPARQASYYQGIAFPSVLSSALLATSSASSATTTNESESHHGEG